ncbi:hypothetical protein [Sphingomonas sp. CARO-RG-8B-R24-01]|uniref:hypothetical protein n=1 Tax=Sphingomonas sp. CARO-RG-8B-R24-01 TaxID=2914831 RepID=UPI001F57D785|nr:hypothetical protein [Sphingomonas sp. CARO-RG-8B-R24-01]
MTDLTSLISSAVSAKMTPEFVEKEVNTRVEKLIVESIDRALRSYSDTGKLIEKAIDDALRVERLDLPSYGNVVAGILKAQIEAKVAPLVAGQLAADMDELLNLAPKEIKLSEIAADMCKRHEGDGYGEVITVIVEHSDYGTATVYLDEEQVLAEHDRRRSEVQLHIGKDGKLLSATMRGRDLKTTDYVGRSYGLNQKIRAYFACGTTITLDEAAVSTSVGDY